MKSQLAKLNSEVIACERCPRLQRHCAEIARVKRRAYRDWVYWGKPITGFGDPNGQLLLIGLAPGAHGANRTGRVFTGDRSGTFLIAAMHRAGFANLPDSVSRDDGLELKNAYISMVVRCAPPDNKPTSAEIERCVGFLVRELDLLPRVQAVLCLGRIALDGYLLALRRKGIVIAKSSVPFAHGAEHELPGRLPRLFTSYHPSQQNTQTGKLTPKMMDEVFGKVRRVLDG